jgi:hypothetical protein
VGIGSTILLAASYGPFAILGAIGSMIGFFAWRNESRKTEHREYDDHRAVDPEALEKYLALPGVKREE